MKRALAVAVAAALATPAQTAASAGSDAYDLARTIADGGPRPAASAAERRAQRSVRTRFRAAGLRIAHDRFDVPGKGRSYNVIGIRDAPASCLRVVMAHSDTVPPSTGAIDNASGLGALAALASQIDDPPCDTWLVATGAEERIHTGEPDHLGSLALVRRIRRAGRAGDLEFALSLDEVGRGRSFWLRSPVPAPREGVERALLTRAERAGVDVRWVRDGGTGNSDHREFELAGLPAMKLGVPDNPCRHERCDAAVRLQRGAFERVLLVTRRLLSVRAGA